METNQINLRRVEDINAPETKLVKKRTKIHSQQTREEIMNWYLT